MSAFCSDTVIEGDNRNGTKTQPRVTGSQRACGSGGHGQAWVREFPAPSRTLPRGAPPPCCGTVPSTRPPCGPDSR